MSKTFTFGKYGEENAMLLAKLFRDYTVAKLTGDENCDELYSKFDSFYKSFDEESELPTGLYYKDNHGVSKSTIGACFDYKGKTWTKSWSINKYGYDEAYRLACEWRKQMEELYYNKPQE